VEATIEGATEVTEAGVTRVGIMVGQPWARHRVVVKVWMGVQGSNVVYICRIGMCHVERKVRNMMSSGG
jgi:hypothetical protein